jgi:polysaccharide biosynthesis transport protein
MERDRQPEDIRFDKYWLILKRHRLPAGILFAGVIAAAGMLASMEKPAYEAQGKLLFRKRDRTASLLTENANKSSELEALNQQNTPIDTEAEVLRSNPLLESVITNLKLQDKKTGKALTPEMLLKNLSVKSVKGADILLVSYKSRDPKEAAAIVNKLINTYIDNNVKLNRAEATAAREFITKQLPVMEARLQQAEGALRLFEEQNEVVSLPDEAKTSVETVAELSQKIAAAKADFDNVSTQSQALQARVARVSSTSARAVNNLNQSAAVQQALGQLQQTEAELATQQTLYRTNHPNIQLLERRRQALSGVLRQRIGEVLGADANVSRSDLQVGLSEQKLIDTLVNTEVSRLGLGSQLNSLIQAQTAYQARANRLPRLQQQRRALERQAETVRNNYDLLVKRLQEVQIAENQDLGIARVVAAATVPNLPAGSKKSLIWAGGSVVGAMLYMLTAFALDLRDPSLKTAKAAREVFPFASLGLIPLLRRKTRFGQAATIDALPKVSVLEHPQSLTSAAYRMLQSNLKFLNPDRNVKSIVVTSCITKEGKSTVCANLAATLAQMGHRVLLVDTDFYRPVQHRIWQLPDSEGLNEVAGLSNVIMSQIEIRKALKRARPNLDILPAGTIPPNPLALIDSKRMTILMQEFAKRYDFVIYDTPPLVLASDVVSLGKKADGVMLVVRPGMIDRAAATEAKNILTQANLEVLGIVTNGVAIEDEPDHYLRRAQEYYDSVPSIGASV